MKEYKRLIFVLIKTENGPDHDCSECCFLINKTCEEPSSQFGFDCNFNGCAGYHWEMRKND